MKQTQH
jgi:hypothetical protein